MNANEERIHRATVALAAYKKELGGWGDYDESITDLLADLMHYVDALTVDREIDSTFEELLRSASNHHSHEKAENK